MYWLKASRTMVTRSAGAFGKMLVSCSEVIFAWQRGHHSLHPATSASSVLLEPSPAFGSVGVFWFATAEGKSNEDNPASQSLSR